MTVHPEELLEPGERIGLIVVAHPDDESIGAAGLISRLGRCQLIHVTDGAPRDRRFWTGAEVRTRAEYARIRRSELARALSLAGVEARCTSGLGVVDQEVSLVLGAIAQRLASAMEALRPDFVVTHAYEGGHPDHDALAFAVWAARRLIEHRGATPPPAFEMAMYHGGPGELVVGQFLSLPGLAEVELKLSEDEKQLKQAMLDCFQSQQETLAPFRALDSERFRTPPEYDFTQAPHEGPLLYEQRGFGITGAHWREQVMKTLRGLDLTGRPDAEGAGRSKATDGRIAGEEVTGGMPPEASGGTRGEALPGAEAPREQVAPEGQGPEVTPEQARGEGTPEDQSAEAPAETRPGEARP